MKVNKVKSLSTVGKYNHTFNILWSLLPVAIVKNNTSKTLAFIIDSMYQQNIKGQDKMYEYIRASNGRPS